MPINGHNSRFPALMDRENNSASSKRPPSASPPLQNHTRYHSPTPMLLILLLHPPLAPALPTPTGKPNLQIRARTEHLPRSCNDDAFHAFVQIEHFVGGFDFFHHGAGEGVVFGRTVEGEEDDGGRGGGGGGDVGEGDVLKGEGGVGGWYVDWGWACHGEVGLG
jgi:hypothetical protein